jgi:hypothetical protein
VGGGDITGAGVAVVDTGQVSVRVQHEPVEVVDTMLGEA